MIYFNLIYSDIDYKYNLNKLKFNYDYILDYKDIGNKLLNNDIFKIEPDDIVINSAILKILNTIYKNKDTYSILFIIKRVNSEYFNNIKNICDSLNKKHNKETELIFHNFSSININLNSNITQIKYVT